MEKLSDFFSNKLLLIELLSKLFSLDLDISLYPAPTLMHSPLDSRSFLVLYGRLRFFLAKLAESGLLRS